jgi:hypothetical protein
MCGSSVSGDAPNPRFNTTSAEAGETAIAAAMIAAPSNSLPSPRAN